MVQNMDPDFSGSQLVLGFFKYVQLRLTWVLDLDIGSSCGPKIVVLALYNVLTCMVLSNPALQPTYSRCFDFTTWSG